MRLRNDATRYGVVAQLFHWTIVVLIVTQFFLANKADGLPRGAAKLAVLAQHKSVGITILALVTGLIAVSLYYYGLRTTPAVAATLAELAFPVTAALVGYLAFDATLTSTQWLGVALTTTVVALLPSRQREVVDVAPAPVPAAA